MATLEEASTLLRERRPNVLMTASSDACAAFEDAHRLVGRAIWSVESGIEGLDAYVRGRKGRK